MEEYSECGRPKHAQAQTLRETLTLSECLFAIGHNFDFRLTSSQTFTNTHIHTHNIPMAMNAQSDERVPNETKHGVLYVSRVLYTFLHVHFRSIDRQ